MRVWQAVVAAMATAVAACAVPTAAVADWIKEQQPIAHGLFVPQAYDRATKYPLVVCLHANSWQGNDNRTLGDGNAQLFSGPTVQDKHPCFVLVPQCPAGQTWVGSHWSVGSYSVDATPITPALQAVMDIVARVRKDYSIDDARIYLVGASMGGQATWDLLGRHPEMFAAAVPVCGCGDPSKAAALEDVGIWAFHGVDDNVIRPDSARQIMANLEKAGSPVRRFDDADPTEPPRERHVHSEYKIGHNVWNKLTPAVNASIVSWLFSQSRTAAKPGDGGKAAAGERAPGKSPAAAKGRKVPATSAP